MARRIREEDLQAIEEVVRRYPEGRTARQIGDALASAPARRTLQYRLKSLVDRGRLIMDGKGRWARYRTPGRISEAAQPVAAQGALGVARGQAMPPLSEAAAEIREHVRQPLEARQPVGYDRLFLDSYRPGETFYLSQAEREHLREVGTPKVPGSPQAPTPGGSWTDC